MIASETVSTLFHLVQVERVQQLLVGAHTANVALLTAQLAVPDMFDDLVDDTFQLLVVIGLFNLEQRLDRVDMLVVYNKVVELAEEALFELDRESTRVYVHATVVQLQAEFLDLGKCAGALKQLRVEALQRDHRLVVDFFQKVLGLLAHLVLDAKVVRVYDACGYVRLVVDVAAAAKVFAKVLAVVERLDLVPPHLDATIGATKILLSLKFIFHK